MLALLNFFFLKLEFLEIFVFRRNLDINNPFSWDDEKMEEYKIGKVKRLRGLKSEEIENLKKEEENIEDKIYIN